MPQLQEGDNVAGKSLEALLFRAVQAHRPGEMGLGGIQDRREEGRRGR